MAQTMEDLISHSDTHHTRLRRHPNPKVNLVPVPLPIGHELAVRVKVTFLDRNVMRQAGQQVFTGDGDVQHLLW